MNAGPDDNHYRRPRRPQSRRPEQQPQEPRRQAPQPRQPQARQPQPRQSQARQQARQPQPRQAQAWEDVDWQRRTGPRHGGPPLAQPAGPNGPYGPPATPPPPPRGRPPQFQPPAGPQHIPPAAPATPTTPKRSLWRWLWRALAVIMVWMLVTPLVYRVWTPPRTMFMLTDSASGPTVYEKVDLDHISRDVIAAVLSHEDAQLGTRAAPYHLGDYMSRTWTYVTKGEDESGSTIPQQLVKNIFLIRGDGFGQEGSAIGVRQAGQVFRVLLKGGDAVLSWPFNLIGDKRQTELYLNYAQFGPNLYGVCAASWYYFNTPPSQVTMTQAATLAGMLPAGEDGKRLPGGGVDRSSDGQWVLNSTIERAQNRMPAAIARSGGSEAVAATIGVTGPVNESGGRNSCATMPDAVAERIEAEGGWY